MDVGLASWASKPPPTPAPSDALPLRLSGSPALACQPAERGRPAEQRARACQTSNCKLLSGGDGGGGADSNSFSLARWPFKSKSIGLDAAAQQYSIDPNANDKDETSAPIHLFQLAWLALDLIRVDKPNPRMIWQTRVCVCVCVRLSSAAAAAAAVA